ncbi:hypothetical protein ACHQM5_030152 [Ranunculus cassubicifolius]
MKLSDGHPNSSNYTLFTFFFFIIVFLCVWFSINEFQLEALQKLGTSTISSFTRYHSTNDSSSSSLNSTLPSPDLRIFMGILTLPDHYPRRNFLRMIYGTQSTAGAQIDVKFVFCNLSKEDQKVLVALEIMRFNDIIILNCTENMNSGKTYTYFSSLPDLFNDTIPVQYDYVMKTDDDTYFRLEALVASLRPLPREDLYYGYVIPCNSMDPFVNYMSGMGFLVSWDIVEWIRTSEMARNHTEGAEDMVFGDWMRWGHKGKNRYNAKWSMYDLPDPPGVCTHELWPNTIAVHKLKNPEKWLKALEYFNVTKDLKPSKLYHIP